MRWLLATGFVVVVAGLAYLEFYLRHPIGSGPAGPSVPPEPFAGEAWTDRPVLLVGIGDSVTAGVGASPGKSYFERLVQNPPDEFEDVAGRNLSRVLPRLTTENLAVSGSTSLQHVDRVRSRLQPQPAEVFGLVVMTSGGNDLIHWYGRSPPAEGAMYGATLAAARPWIDNYERRIDTLCQRIKSCFPGGCAIFLADIYDPSDGGGDPESVWMPAWPDCAAILAEYNAALRRAAARHPEVRVVPLHDTFLGHGIHCRKIWRRHYRVRDPYYWYADNIEDPNDRGYDAIRRLFLNEMAKEGRSLFASSFNAQPEAPASGDSPRKPAPPAGR